MKDESFREIIKKNYVWCWDRTREINVCVRRFNQLSQSTLNFPQLKNNLYLTIIYISFIQLLYNHSSK